MTGIGTPSIQRRIPRPIGPPSISVELTLGLGGRWRVGAHTLCRLVGGFLQRRLLRCIGCRFGLAELRVVPRSRGAAGSRVGGRLGLV